VQRVAEDLRATPAGGAHRSFRKKAVSHEVPKRADGRRHDRKVDVSDMAEILEIDAATATCWAEPGVTFADLVGATLPHGLVPTVVPELETITVGGAVSGCSLESMSFRYGGFHDSCLEYEVVTTDGAVLRCTPQENPLVFDMMHGSFGTLGFLAGIRFRLVPAKPWVHVVYERHTTLTDFKRAIRRRSLDGKVDFLDAILHDRSTLVLCVGRFVDHVPYTHRYDWVTPYYRTTAKRREDYFRTRDYLFRYDRGVTNPTPRSLLGRILFGKVLDSATLLRLANRFPRLLPGRPDVTLDMFFPFSRLDAFMGWYDRTIGYYPLWCVPYRLPRPYPWIEPSYLEGVTDELFVDIAVYGLRQPRDRNYYKEIEEALPAFQGIKTLISHNYFDERSFWKIWNRSNYEVVKAITDRKNVLRDLYTKTCRTARGL
jgi:hypothetical protein